MWRTQIGCYVLICCSIISVRGSEPLTNLEVAFTKDEFSDYVHYFSGNPISADSNISNDTEMTFLITKGAEILIEEAGKMFEVNLSLRRIDHVREVTANSTYQYVLFVEDLHRRHIFRVTVLGKLSYSQNMSSIHAALITTDMSKNVSSRPLCDQISQLSNCTKCTDLGRCEKGHVPLDPWLKFALKTQREIQVNKCFTEFQFLEAHNAFNNRADLYGVLDDCKWPPPYKEDWVCLANQEFSFTDLLDIGVHALELDTWWCFGKIRLSHATKRALGCAPVDRPYSEGIREIAEWVKQPQNRGKVIRLYLEDGAEHTEGHNDLINGPIREYLDPYVFRPSDLQRTFQGFWPTIKQMREMNRTVIIATGGYYTHGGEYIHHVYWHENPVNEFTPYPNCSGVSLSIPRRYYSDSTNYGPIWNGPKETGVILDFAEFAKCRVEYPAADQVNTAMLRSAIYTWAEGEPSRKLMLSSCVYLSASNGRWYVAHNCSLSLYQACSKLDNSDIWVLSRKKGPSNANSMCPEGYRFDLPNDGFRKQKLLESMNGSDAWINIEPYLPQLINDRSP